MKVLYLILLISVNLALGQGQFQQRTTLYEGRNQLGDFLLIPQTYAPDLSLNNFNDRAHSVCVTGMWVFYVNPFYNNGSLSGVEYVFGPNNYCTNFFTVGGYISSAKYIGSATDYRASSFTLFQEDYFQGTEEYTFVDLPSLHLDSNHKSLAITGDVAWTIFDQPGYTGNAICLYPDPSKYPEPYLLVDFSSIQIPNGSIRSVRKGCVGVKENEATGEVHGDNSVGSLARFGKQ